jgi:hypothetical protein
MAGIIYRAGLLFVSVEHVDTCGVRKKYSFQTLNPTATNEKIVPAAERYRATKLL